MECQDCGTRLDHGLCPNCQELQVIEMISSFQEAARDEYAFGKETD